jgi:hypothetical protein
MGNLEHLKASKKPVAAGKWSGQGPPAPAEAAAAPQPPPPTAKAPARKNTGKERRPGRRDYEGLIRGERLPPGSRKELVWDGQAWRVTMIVPSLASFVAEGPSELTTLYLAHSKYAQTAARIAKGLDI